MSSGDLDDRSLAIVRHIARLRLSFTEAIRFVACKGADPEARLRALKASDHIGTRAGYGGNRVAYVLGPRGAAAMGAGRRAGEAAGPAAEPRHLAVFSYCMLKKRSRVRLLNDEVAELFGDARMPRSDYCLEYTQRTKRVESIYAPGAATPPNEVARMAASRIRALCEPQTLRPWLTNGVLGLAILVHERERAARLNTAIKEERLDDSPLSHFADVNVEVVPGPHELSEALSVLA